VPLSDVRLAAQFLDRLLAWYDEGHAHNP